MFSQCLAVFIKKAPPLLFLLNMPIFFFLRQACCHLCCGLCHVFFFDLIYLSYLGFLVHMVSLFI